MEQNSEPGFISHIFEDTLLDVPVTFLLLKMKECLFIWVGDQGNFDSLAVAMNTPYSNIPICSSVMGYFADDDSCSLALKLSKRTNKQIFASYNLATNNNKLNILVHDRIIKELTEHPEKF
ncbi:proteasome assembly chaperone 4-like [Stegodyphus dumicola]|uniref:proteasome assembly chaperone 4-like n=1 Tax=Stegodyphus dumicola TaxID=202533 RepID=UPI0015B1B448|nr:proteasome assembly chaperone 4-like [Stegodyphus dumicola]